MIQAIVSILILLEQALKQDFLKIAVEWLVIFAHPSIVQLKHFNCSIETVAMQYNWNWNGIMEENNAFVLHFVHHGNALFLSPNLFCNSFFLQYINV